MKTLFIPSVLAVVLLGAAQFSYADPVVFTANLTGSAEVPSNLSPGAGTATVTYDSVAHTLRVQVTFSGLQATTIAAHIHSATTIPGVGNAGVATTTPTFAGFPLGVTSGTYDMTLDLTLSSSWNPTFITNHGGTTASAEAALALSLANGTAYLNIHTTQFPGGEIRGFLVPEPATMLLLGTGLAGLAFKYRRRGKAIRNRQT